MKGIIAGVAGGILGAILWGVIASLTGFEIGWIAWGIGVLVGAGVAWGTEGGTVPGVLAVIISVLAILGGKFVALEMVMNKEIKSADQNISMLVDSNEEYLVSWLADAIVYKMQEEGSAVNWPAGVDPQDAQAEADYPPEIWAKAKAAYISMKDQEREEFKEKVRQQASDNIKAIASGLKQKGFLASFGPIDIVFFLLAIATAYKIGSKSQPG
jgi:hypothetical protein